MCSTYKVLQQETMQRGGRPNGLPLFAFRLISLSDVRPTWAFDDARYHVSPMWHARNAHASPGATTLERMPISSTQRLQDQLDTITANTRELVQPERLAITDQAVQDMLAAHLEERILPVGSQAPAFALQDSSTGKPVRSDDLLAVGPLVINFFRGWWCPYCIAELEAWQAAYPALRERGALLVAISPLTKRQNDFTVQRHDFTYPLLSDPGNKVAETFGVAYTVPEPMQRHYRSILVNIPFLNG